jgi:hypothetical protein
MPNQELFVISAIERKLELLHQCKNHLEKKMFCLLTQQIGLLENCLSQDAELQEEIFQQDTLLEQCKADLLKSWGCLDTTLSWKNLGNRFKGSEASRFKELQAAILQVVEEIQALNYKNMALIESGHMYVEMLLNAIWPSATYSPDKASRYCIPPSRISLEC